MCFGDSITFGLGVRLHQKWTYLASGRSDWQVVNQGVNGDTTGGMLVRLQTLLADPALRNATAEHPRVLLLGGSNDIFYSGSDVCARANMGAMIHQLQSAGIQPVVGIPLPFDPVNAPSRWAGVVDYAGSAALLEAYCRWLRDFCAAFGVQTIDFRADFLTPEGQVRRALFLDGMHPNADGHSIMAERLCKEILI